MPGMQGRRNVGPPQTMAWSESQHPARQLQPSSGPLVEAGGEPAALSSSVAQHEGRLREQGAEDHSAVHPAADGAVVDNGDGSESSTGARDEFCSGPASSSLAAVGQKVGVLSLASGLKQGNFGVPRSL